MKEIVNNSQSKVIEGLTNDGSADYGTFAQVRMGKGKLVLIPVESTVSEKIQPLTFAEAVANGERQRQGIAQEPEHYGEKLGSIIIY